MRWRFCSEIEEDVGEMTLLHLRRYESQVYQESPCCFNLVFLVRPPNKRNFSLKATAPHSLVNVENEGDAGTIDLESLSVSRVYND